MQENPASHSDTGLQTSAAFYLTQINPIAPSPQIKSARSWMVSTETRMTLIKHILFCLWIPPLDHKFINFLEVFFGKHSSYFQKYLNNRKALLFTTPVKSNFLWTGSLKKQKMKTVVRLNCSKTLYIFTSTSNVSTEWI